MRIRKAMEYGAVWVKEWTDGVSHIIADKHLTYRDIIKYLKVPSLPVGSLFYSSECYLLTY